MEDQNDTNTEEVLNNAIIMAEIGVELKERCTLAEKYLSHLKLLLTQANKAIVTLQTTSKLSLQQAKKLLTTVPISTNDRNATKQDYDRLLALIEKQLSEIEEIRDPEPESDSISERIKFLESKQKSDLNLPPSSSSRSIKGDVDEKYPENWSRDSSIDLNSVVNLPPVPEDVFTSFSSKPKRSSSLSSLKSMRKVKLFLQRAETSDEEDVSSEPDDHELGQKGDSDDASPTKKFLGNITEET